MRGWQGFGGLLRDFVLSLALALLIVLFLYQPVKVEGTSMMPNLMDQERLFINKFVYRLGFTTIRHGDTVVFWYPHDPSKSYIKRVIGVPGDRVRIEEGIVFLNGVLLDEPYVPDQFRDRISVVEATVPADHYYVMGDHRTSSNDSRSWGPVPRAAIYGKAVFAYWPLDRMGLVP